MSDDYCSICMSTITDDKYTVSTCGHVFHKECLWPWKKETNKCPMCTGPIDVDEETRGLQPNEAEEQSMARRIRLRTLAQILLVIPIPEIVDEFRAIQEQENEYQESLFLADAAQCARCMDIGRSRDFTQCNTCITTNYCSSLCKALDFEEHQLTCVERRRCMGCNEPHTSCIFCDICGDGPFCKKSCIDHEHKGDSKEEEDVDDSSKKKHC